MSAVDANDAEVRSIEATEVTTRFARGWHCLGLASSYGDGQPHTINAFGGKLVVFQGEDGTVNVLDAYCRHMGGDLSQGSVRGNEIACPFHDWRWGGDGRCKQIPYSRRVPLRARTKAWPTMQRDGLLFVWNDPEGNQPPEEFAVPAIRGLEEGEWTDWLWKPILVNVNCREIIDNVVDMAHFFYVHGAFPTSCRNVFEGHVATQYYEGHQRDDLLMYVDEDGKPMPKLLKQYSEASYYGPSYMIDYLSYEFEAGMVDTVLINCHYPVTKDSFILQYGLRVKKPEGMPTEESESMAKAMAKGVEAGFLQDVQIWKNKARIDNPLLCEEDGPVYQLRRWYEQFYVDAAEVTPEMTDRFEFEIDTSKAIEAWKQEVADNLAKQQAVGV
ncbi:Rieske 2Fe-2S domain-containing protein [Sciscionella marina]|uniref:Rieske 2Fe-2S domain-containing protein n=1 Tax=Sciscionella marina TaxID=508770 RepID=UPI0004764292|nr:Rieske 2Fe-2S domain-containing protein [Sciscionella marina]